MTDCTAGVGDHDPDKTIDPSAPTEPTPPPSAKPLNEKTLAEIAREWEARKAWVMHVGTRVIGPVQKFYDGVTDVFVDPSGTRLEGAAVLKLGAPYPHALLAPEADTFLELTDRESEFYERASRSLGDFLIRAAQSASLRQIPMPTGVTLLASMLRAAASQVEATLAAVTPSSPTAGDVLG